MAIISSSIVPALPRVNAPTRDQATAVVSQVSDALNSATSSNQVSNRAVVAFRLMKESPETQEVVAQVVSDPDVFTAIWAKLQKMPSAFEKIVEAATSCLIPGDHEDRKSLWIPMFRKVIDALSGVWDLLLDLFADAIHKIQANFAGQGGSAKYLETALIITGLAVLVTAVIVMEAILVL